MQRNKLPSSSKKAKIVIGNVENDESTIVDNEVRFEITLAEILLFLANPTYED